MKNRNKIFLFDYVCYEHTLIKLDPNYSKLSSNIFWPLKFYILALRIY